MSNQKEEKKDADLVSVIIPCFNYERFIKGAIDSALNQTYPNIEVIVVDDGSTDGTGKLLQKYRDRIKYIYQSNRGPSAARNCGLREAKGTYVTFLDADDEMKSTSLSHLVKALKDNDSASFACGKTLTFNGKISALKLFIDNILPIWRLPKNSDIGAHVCFRNIGPPGSILLKRSQIEDHGVQYDESMKWCEDHDFLLRVFEKFGSPVVAPESVLYYRLHPDSLSKMSNKMIAGDIEMILKVYECIMRMKNLAPSTFDNFLRSNLASTLKTLVHLRSSPQDQRVKVLMEHIDQVLKSFKNPASDSYDWVNIYNSRMRLDMLRLGKSGILNKKTTDAINALTGNSKLLSFRRKYELSRNLGSEFMEFFIIDLMVVFANTLPKLVRC